MQIEEIDIIEPEENYTNGVVIDVDFVDENGKENKVPFLKKLFNQIFR